MLRHCSPRYWQSFWCLHDYREEAWKSFALFGISPSCSRASGCGGIRNDKWCVYWPWSSSLLTVYGALEGYRWLEFSTDDSMEALVASAPDDILNFTQVNLELKEPQDDYHEFLDYRWLPESQPSLSHLRPRHWPNIRPRLFLLTLRPPRRWLTQRHPIPPELYRPSDGLVRFLR